MEKSLDPCLVRLAPEVFKKVQRLAVLAGSESTAIERLIEYWEKGHRSESPEKALGSTVDPRQVWQSPRGDVLPVGLELEAFDGGITHHAIVEVDGIKYDGHLYDSPSAAAKAVKAKRGLTGVAANTDGPKFWKFRDPKTNRLRSINVLRPSIDSNQLLAELDS